ncbi:MAG: sigma-54 dependent transcriptional regulator [Myxococcaceae bacterium]
MTETVKGDPVRVVVIDDDRDLLKAISRLLERSGFSVDAVFDPVEGLSAASEPGVDVVLSDVQMPNLTGMDLLKELKNRKVGAEVVLVTGHGSIDAAVEALKLGAFDYFTKPFTDHDRLVRTLQNAAAQRRLKSRTAQLEQMLEVKENFEDLVGTSPKMTDVFKLVNSIAYASTTVLITGEGGTGKELVARAIHRRSPRKNKPFVAVNCGALTETLLESELFGHVKGSFTGATSNRRGLFQAADGGTLFLDEIGEMAPSLQVKLLRVLQESKVKPVGSNDELSVDVRVVAATNVDLAKAKAAGRFREDLFYRLNVIAVSLPPLRDRPEDIAPLVHHFIGKYAKKSAKTINGLTRPTMERLVAHGWPGNVRELENAIERAVVVSQSNELVPEDLPGNIGSEGKASTEEPASLTHLPFYQARELNHAAFERRYCTTILKRTEGNITRAAELAGVDRSNFRRLLKTHKIEAKPEPGEEG